MPQQYQLIRHQILPHQHRQVVLHLNPRAFDSVCIVVPGIITCIADACLRRMAVDCPSPFSGTLLGINAKDGRRLGFPGFGLGLGGFAAQVETIEVHTLELSVAATSMLDYFGSPDQNRLDMISRAC